MNAERPVIYGISPLAVNFLNASRSGRDIAHEQLPPGTIQDVERELTALAQTAGECAAYLMKRGASGCGDSGHEDAIKYAKKRLIAIRRALGFSYP